MSASRLVPLLAGAACLAACASQPTPPPAAPAPPPAAPPLAADASPYGLFLAGRAARDEGHLGAAALYLGRAAQDEGEPAYLKTPAFQAALDAGDVPAAAALAPDGADANPAEVRLGVLVRGVETMAEGKNKEAYAILAGPDEGYPFKVAALLVAPFAAAGAGDAATALARPALSGDPLAQFSADLDQCELYERLGKPREAEAGFKVLMQNADAGGVVAAAYGAFLERRGRSSDAAALYRDAAARFPDDPGLAAALARAQKHGRAPPLGGVRQGAASALILPAAGLIAQKQEGLALIDLRLALRLDPANDEAWVLLGDILAPGDVEAARAAYEHVAPGADQYVAARGKLAWSYQNGDDRDQAVKLARETAAAFAGSRDATVTLADLLRENDQYTESAAVLSKLIDGPGAKPDWRLYFLRASAYDESNQPEKTQADLAAALKLDPDEPELLNFQGYFWIERGERLNEALAMVQKAVDAEPQSGAMVDSLGWAYYRLGDFKSAVAKLEDAVTLEPSAPEINDHLGDAYWRVGRKIEAQFQWRRVLSLDPGPALKTRAATKLASPLGPDAAPGPPPAATSTP